jgi:hypothetical protein
MNVFQQVPHCSLASDVGVGVFAARSDFTSIGGVGLGSSFTDTAGIDEDCSCFSGDRS